MLSVAVLASGGGSNFQSLIDHARDGSLPVSLRLLVTNNSQCGSVDRAHRAGIPVAHISGATHPDPKELEHAMLSSLRQSGVELVVLAGYMKHVPDAVLAAYPNRVLNIHPALLPSFGGHGHYGIHVHEAVLMAGAKVSGVTVHLVDAKYDCGAILAQKSVAVLAGDTPDSLQQRVLVQEHDLYWRVIRAFAQGRIASRTLSAPWIGDGAVRKEWVVEGLED